MVETRWCGTPLATSALACGVLLVAALLAPGVAGADPLPRVEIAGKALLDPRPALTSALGLARGMPTEPKAVQRLLRHLDALGYRARVERRPDRVVLHLAPYRVIRKIFISGNWPIFEDEILRRIRFRPGQRLPEGKALDKSIELQEERVKRFLSTEGYYDGHLRIYVKPTSAAHQVNLQVRILKGKRYKVGAVRVRRVDTSMAALEPTSRRRKRAAGDPELAVPAPQIRKMFLQKLLFYQRAFSTERFKEDVKNLVQQYHELDFPGVRVRESYRVDRKRPADEAVRIALRIQQRKKVFIRFAGNDEIKSSKLKEALTIYDEGTYDDYELAESAKAIRRLYQSKGFLQARVHFTRQVGERTDQVTFHLAEGPRFRIKEVLFAGNRSVSRDVLGKVVRTRTFPCLGYVGLGEGGYITDLQLQQDVERLEQYYRGRGFPAVKVRGELAPHQALLGRPGALAAAMGAGAAADDGDLYIRFIIDEGKQLLVEGVQIHGNKAISAAILKRQLALKPRRPFTTKMLTLDKARLVRIYSERGLPYTAVRSMEEQDLSGTKVTIHFSVQENRRVRFGPIFIRGNFKTRPGVIMEDLDFKPGEPFDIRKIEAAERALRKREIFNVVRVQPVGMSDQLAQVPVLVQLEERYDDHGSLEFAVGGSTDNKLFGSVAYRNDNLLGFATQLSLKAEYGWEIQSGNLHYRDRRLFGTNLIFNLKGYVRNEETERLGQIQTFGGVLSLSYEFLPKLTGALSYEIRQIQYNEDIFYPAGVDVSSQVKVANRTGGFGPTIVWDRRDNPLNPTSGWRLAASAQWASPYLGGSDHFIKLNVSGQGYIPLPLGTMIAVSVRYDHAFPLGDTVLLPKPERFYAGGDTTIRGFEEDMAFAERTTVALAPLSGVTLLRERPQGGQIRLLTNVEFMFPIWQKSILFGLPLMGAVFTDHGFVTNSYQGFDIDQLRHSVGPALRIVTPVGFTSIAFAFPVPFKSGSPDGWRLHFNFGFIF